MSCLLSQWSPILWLNDTKNQTRFYLTYLVQNSLKACTGQESLRENVLGVPFIRNLKTFISAQGDGEG